MIIAMLADQKRLHLQHGPIDLIIEAFGEQAEIAAAYRAASLRFDTVLDELVAELSLLRTPIPSFPRGDGECGKIAKEMFAAVRPYADNFITPMAAVAGAVANEMLGVMLCHAELDKAYVNNGGDIALYLHPDKDQSFRTGVVSDPNSGELVTIATIAAQTDIKGIATSGWLGRSHSLGIADSVTVFARSAAAADAAATIIANHVDLPDCPKIFRQPASQLSPDSDLHDQLVTVAVGSLADSEIEVALSAGEKIAQDLCHDGLISAAFLCLQRQAKIVHWPADHSPQYFPQSDSTMYQDRISHA